MNTESKKMKIAYCGIKGAFAANVAERISLLYPRTGSAEILSDGLRGARVHVVFGTL